MLDAAYLDSKEGSSITDDPGILATLYPALLKLVRAELRAQGRNQELAEDIAHTAALRWFEVATTEKGAESYLRKFVQRYIQNLARRTEDASSRIETLPERPE